MNCANFFARPHAARGLDLLRHSGLLEHVLRKSPPQLLASNPRFSSRRQRLQPSAPHARAVANRRRSLLALGAAPPRRGQTSHRFQGIRTPAASISTSTKRLGPRWQKTSSSGCAFPQTIDEVVQAVRCHMQFKDFCRCAKPPCARLLLRPTFPPNSNCIGLIVSVLIAGWTFTSS